VHGSIVSVSKLELDWEAMLISSESLELVGLAGWLRDGRDCHAPGAALEMGDCSHC